MNKDQYARNMLEPFFEQVTADERQYGYFQQDSFTTYIARNSVSAQQEVFLYYDHWYKVVSSAHLSGYNFYM